MLINKSLLNFMGMNANHPKEIILPLDKVPLSSINRWIKLAQS